MQEGVGRHKTAVIRVSIFTPGAEKQTLFDRHYLAQPDAPPLLKRHVRHIGPNNPKCTTAGEHKAICRSPGELLEAHTDFYSRDCSFLIAMP